MIVSGKKVRAQKGFTLVELMIVIAVMAIMAAIAFPSYQTLMAKNRLNGAARQVMSDLMEARMKAVKENTTVTVKRLSSDEYKISTASEEKTIDIKLNYHDVTIESFSNISFYSRGTASFRSITLTSRSTGESKKVTIAITGRVKIIDL